MHVLHLTIPFEYACGISRHVWCLARIQARRHRVTVATSGGSALEILEPDGVPWVRAPIDPAEKSLFNVARAIGSLRRYVRDEEVSVIHAHHRYHAVLARAISLLGRRVVVVATCHYVDGRTRLVNYPVTRIIAVSQATRRYLRAHLDVPEDRITVIPHCLPPPLPVIDEIDARLSDTARPLVVSIGRLSPEKGFETFVRAMALLRTDPQKPRGVVVGDGPLRTYLERLAAEIQSPLIFTGSVRGAQPYLARATIVVQPSLAETASLTVLEAGAYGRAVIATNVGGLPETIRNEETGLVVPPGDYEALALAIATLLGDEELRTRLGSALQHAVKPRLDPGPMVEAVVRVYAAAGAV